MTNRVQILDCTLRDGGLGLEDAHINQISECGFSAQQIDKIIMNLEKSNIDIIELGSIEISSDDKRKWAIYQDVESVSFQLSASRSADQMFVGLYRGPDTPIEDIPQRSPDMVDGVRVIIRYSELQKSMDFCAALSEKGYKVFVQPMLTMRYTDEELDYIIRKTNEMNAYALYFVDSYGYMQADDIFRFMKKFDSCLKDTIRIGFHAHNNMNLAYANALAFINYDTDRNIIVDSCALGMGQGAGNLQTELIVPYLNGQNKNRYDYNAVLNVCEEIESFLAPNIWGYSVTRLLPALHKTAYKYAIALRNHYKLSYAEINQLLANIPEDLRHRYTPENTKKLLGLTAE